jgi:hypothetical protein
VIYAAVAATPSRFYTVASPTVLPAHLVFDDDEDRRVHSPGHPAPGGLKLAATDTYRVAVMQSHAGRVLCVNQHGNSVDLAPSFGTNCVHVEALDEQNFMVCAITDADTWTRWTINGSLRNATITGTFAIPDHVGAASGWLQFAFGQPIWTDANRQWPVSGPPILTLPIHGQFYRVGQCNSHGRGGVDALSPTGELFHVSSQLSQIPPSYAERPDGSAAVAVSGDVAEFVHSVQFTHQPQPQPDPTPDPEPQPMPDTTKLHAALLSARAKYPEILEKPEHAAFILSIACLAAGPEWGLSAKPTGNRVPSPLHGVDVAYDICHHRAMDKLFDVATGEWQRMEIREPSLTRHHGDPNRPWLAPVQPNTDPIPKPDPRPDPIPDPKPGELDHLVAALDDATEVLRKLQPMVAESIKAAMAVAEVQGAMVEKMAEFSLALRAIQEKQPPRYRGRVLGTWVTLTPEGS